MKARTLALIPIAALAGFGLAACGEKTATADEIAESAEDSLEEQIGQRPEIDCGSDDVTLEKDKVVDCVLTDPSTGTEYDTTVTIVSIDGNEWKGDVKVADEPRE
ncbi:hypothetical protein [Salininema proteolyticum]|uniref:DUF4333 domain-containing protein n=1 Tax=Salininema proteolyticum TaxID=1607685 RepID=A0ABV8TXL5_9ACTN